MSKKTKLSESPQSQHLGPLSKAHSQENKLRKSGISFMLKVKLKKCLFSKSFSKNQIRKKVLPMFMREMTTSVYLFSLILMQLLTMLQRPLVALF